MRRPSGIASDTLHPASDVQLHGCPQNLPTAAGGRTAHLPATGPPHIGHRGC